MSAPARPLTAEILSVGTELLLGEILDSNAAWLAQELSARGVTLQRKSTVGDNLGRIVEALRLALSRADLVLVGGGLGPTDDDLTREAIAEVLGETPIVDDAALAHLRHMFESRGRTFPDSNRKQAWTIPSAEVLANPHGTAPGWFVRTDGKFIVAMPGPPREMHPMWREQAAPRLPLPARSLWRTTLHTWGIGESHVAEALGDLTQAANPSVATYARRHGVDVRVAASAGTQDEARELAAPVARQVQEALARYVYGHDEQTLAGAALEALGAHGENVASLEVGAGVLAELLTAREDRAYAGGLTATLPQTLLDVGLTPHTLQTHGVHSQEAALELARGVRARFASVWGVVSVPGPRSFMAVSGPRGERAATLEWPSDRRTVTDRAAHSALMLLLRETRKEHT